MIKIPLKMLDRGLWGAYSKFMNNGHKIMKIEEK